MFTSYDPHANTSYITYTPIELIENNKQPLTLDQVVDFFRNEEARRSHHSPKDTHPYSRMRNACLISAEKNFNDAHENITSCIQTNWSMHTPIPTTISRFVIQLNLTEALARKLYEEKKFNLLSVNIIGAREDIFSQNKRQWQKGMWQPVVRLDMDNQQRKCAVM